MSAGYSDEDKQRIIDHVLAECATGRFISRIIAEDDDMPAPSTWWLWTAQDDALSDKVERAREHGIEALLDECGEIADDAVNDYMERQIRGNTEIVFNKENVLRSKLRIETRIKLAQMLKPKKYGPKLDLTSAGKALGLSDAMRAAEKRLSDDSAES